MILYLILGIAVLWFTFSRIMRASTVQSDTDEAVLSRSTCRWGRDRRRPRESVMTRWICAQCGADAYSHDGQPPKDCKRHLRDAVL